MLWLIPLVPVVAAMLLFRVWSGGCSRVTIALSAAAVVVTELVLVVWGGAAGWTAELSWSGQLTLTLSLTPTTFLAALVVPVVAAPIVFYAAAHEDTERLGRLIALLVVFTGVMELIILAREMLSLLIAWEIAGALSWSLIGHQFQDKTRGRHATQAFLTTRAGDLGLYLAAFIAFQQNGSLAYEELDQMSPAATGLFAAGVCLAALSKSAQLPFSPWLFAAMSGPASVSALLHAATMVAAGVLLLFQLQPVLATVHWFGPLLITAGLATALAAGVVAAASPHAKRLLAASTSAHYGLMFVAIGAGHSEIALLHFSMHALMKTPLFMLAGISGDLAGSYELRDIADTPAPQGLRLSSWLAVLALAGLMPLGAAWSKEEVVVSAGLVAPWLAVLVAFAGGLSALYAARFQTSLFPPTRAPERARDSAVTAVSMLQRAPIYGVVALVLLSSLLWVPAIERGLGQMLAVSFPSGKLWELFLSLALVLAGLYGGYRVALRDLGQRNKMSAIRNFFSHWMRLPQAAQRLVVTPVDAVATRLAMLDDLAVDAGVRGCARLALWFATLGSRFWERLFDSMPEGLARLTGWAGERTGQLQSGMLHHYYSLMAVGAGTLALLLVLAAITGGLF